MLMKKYKYNQIKKYNNIFITITKRKITKIKKK